jgi:hypothetical protein
MTIRYTGRTLIEANGDLDAIIAGNASAQAAATVASANAATALAAAAAATAAVAAANAFIALAPINPCVAPYNCVGNGVADDTAGLQAALDAASSLGRGLYCPAGTYVVTTMLTLTGNSIIVDLDDHATILYSTPNHACLKITGTKCSVRGGFGGGFVDSAPTWDGTNAAPTYGVIWVTGDNTTIRTRLINVRRTGIWFKDVVDGDASGTYIEGNYPTGQWTGVETGHVGIFFDPSTAATAGNFKAVGVTVKSCVQGVFGANYGAGQTMQSLVVTGSILQNCWNHGVYAYGVGHVVSGNSFNRCSIPIALQGQHHTVIGNTLYTSVSGVGDARDATGISMRDSQYCVVTGNTIKGVNDPSSPGAINFQNLDGLQGLDYNVCSGNTIQITAGLGFAIRFIGNTVSSSFNVCDNNTVNVYGNALANEGAIIFYGLAAGGNVGNSASFNKITLNGRSNGVSSTYQTGSDFSHNIVNYAWDDGAGVEVNTVYLYSGTDCTVDRNVSICSSSWGTNLTIIGYKEVVAAARNCVSNNRHSVNLTKAVAFVPIVTLAGGLARIDEVADGVPASDCQRGSIWRRTDGASGTTLYMNEADGAHWKNVEPTVLTALPANGTDLATTETLANALKALLISIGYSS